MTCPVHNSARAVGLLLVALGCVALVGCTGGTSLDSLLGGNTLSDLLGNLTGNQSGSQTPSEQGTTGNQTGGGGTGAAGNDQDADDTNGGAADGANDGDADDTGGFDNGGGDNGGGGGGGGGDNSAIVGDWDVMFTAVAIASEDAGIKEGGQRPGSWTFSDNGDGTVKLTSPDGSLDGSWTGSSYYFEQQFTAYTLSTGEGYTTYKIECFPRDSTSMYGTMEMDYSFNNYMVGLIPQGHDAYSFEATRRG